jgi:hypothetical protein
MTCGGLDIEGGDRMVGAGAVPRRVVHLLEGAGEEFELDVGGTQVLGDGQEWPSPWPY